MKDDLSQFGFYLNEMINGIFLIEIMTVLNLSKALKNRATHISTLFNFIGETDTCISIASLRSGSKNTCRPVFLGKGKNLSTRGVYHPLIANCVSNDINIKNHSVLITGSNMSGKTTFLRTMIINSILAQSIYTCFADEFSTPLLRQFSSIRIDDNLFEGKSYFFEEVNVIGLFIEAMQSAHQNLFVLDEVFRGTNSIERAALTKAILSYLNKGGNIVIVSSHDVELSDLLRNEYDVYHFTEDIENRQLYFDHRLRPGPLRTRNAIRLLEIGEFPSEIISEARALSSRRRSDLDYTEQ
jgi:DNA mismatch repair ATPase MutS